MATETRPSGRIDRVAATGAVTVLVGIVALPFVVFRANRIVAGAPLALTAAGPAGIALVVFAVAALAAAAAPAVWPHLAARRPLALKVAAAGMFGSLAWALGQAAVRLLVGATTIARVSIGAGAWVALVGVAVVEFAADSQLARGWPRRAVTVAALVGVACAALFGGMGSLSIVTEYRTQSSFFWMYVGQHLTLAGSGLLFGLVLGIPLAVAATRWRPVRDVTLGVVGVIQTVPSMALLGLLVIPLAAAGLPGIGPLPAIIALTLYSLLPIVRNTYIGLSGVDPAVVDAGRGMGMSRAELLFKVEAPLALPLAIEGVRAAAVLVIGITAVTAFVGAGGLGVLVFLGWGQQADDLILLGAIPMVVLSLLADAGLRALAAYAVSPGIRGGAA
jgi:osmoprotectant transport system permease protein